MDIFRLSYLLEPREDKDGNLWPTSKVIRVTLDVYATVSFLGAITTIYATVFHGVIRFLDVFMGGTYSCDLYLHDLLYAVYFEV